MYKRQAIKPCTVPAAGEPGFELADDEMEIGIGTVSYTHLDVYKRQ